MLSVRTYTFPMVARVLFVVVVVVACVLTLRWQDAGAQGGDDHGNYLNNSNAHYNLVLRLRAESSPATIVDVFRLTALAIQGVHDVWIYTTGDLNTRGRTLRLVRSTIGSQ